MRLGFEFGEFYMLLRRSAALCRPRAFLRLAAQPQPPRNRRRGAPTAVRPAVRRTGAPAWTAWVPPRLSICVQGRGLSRGPPSERASL